MCQYVVLTQFYKVNEDKPHYSTVHHNTVLDTTQLKERTKESKNFVKKKMTLTINNIFSV